VRTSALTSEDLWDVIWNGAAFLAVGSNGTA
jgi:hypothetical protein